ncbi:MAG TPA: TonB-dependent receptor plug domain-containing protein [Steroidobacteraceae bacterium]|nr:TonB-dependent receptor plug domain-containing protein [Steroidobacteraceae bacterium]
MSCHTPPSRALRTAIRSVLLIPAVALVAPAVVQAQSQSPGAGVLEEIVVTARKREESLQEVPIAVTAFSEQKLEAIGMRSLEDIALRTPGLQFSEQAGQIAGRFNCSIRFRGMNVNSEQAVYQLGALFIDGIYVASGCSSIAAEDLARVEVVKGPQAVYFGRNTFGGAVNYVTKDPGNEWGSRVTATFAEDDDYEYTASVEGPIVSDKAAIRLSGRYYDRGGIFTSNFGDPLGEQKTRSVAAKIVLTPTDAFTVRIRGFYGEDRDGPSAGGFISGNLNDTCTGTTGPNGEPRARYICGELPGINSAVTTNNGSLISYNTSLDPNAFAADDYLRTQLLENGANDPAIDAAIGLDYFGLKRNTTYVGATADYEFSNGWVLSGVAGYNEMRANWLRDFDFTDDESWWSTDPQNLEDTTLEIRLTSDQDGPISWVVGAAWYEMEYTQSGNGGTAVTAFPICVGAPPGTCVGAPPQPPSGTFLTYIPLTFNNSLVNNVDQEYTAFFGGITWRMTDQWSLSVEGR